MAKINKPASSLTQTPARATPAAATARTATPKPKRNDTLIFGRENYKWMLIGAGLIALGLIAMSGGSMPKPEVWDPSIIYSTMRITIAPILIIAGLGVEIYAIFKKNAQ
jgi:Protein of unknown function (DUF3098)